MTKVDFYVLSSNEQKALVFACQMITTLYKENKTVFVFTATQQAAEQFDQLLWTFAEDSFTPHQLAAHSIHATPIQIGFDEPSTQQDILFNLSHTLPHFYTKYKNVVEIVFNQTDIQQLARERFRMYRDQGCEMNTIKNSSF